MNKPSKREVPDFLSPEDERRFFDDPDWRDQRRQDKRNKLPPRMDRVLRGYRRQWLFGENDPIPAPIPFPGDIAALLEQKMKRLAQPLIDKITEGHDIGIPHTVALNPYLHGPAARYKQTVAEEGHTGQARQAMDQAAGRMPVHVGDDFQRNVWIKMRIADLRAGYIAQFLTDPEKWRSGGMTPAAVADAVADFGYCFRYGVEHDRHLEKDERLHRFEPGLLKNIGADKSLVERIEHIGLYAADGHPEVLTDNLVLLGLVGSQQLYRSEYWGSRFDVSVGMTGLTLPRDDRETDDEIVMLLQELYGQPEEA